MNIKKLIAKILGVSLIVSTIATSALTMGAISISETDNITKTFSHAGTYSKLYAYNIQTGIVSSSNYPDYAGSYKIVYFRDYTYNATKKAYYKRYEDDTKDTARSMVTSPASSSSAIAKRYHTTKIYYTSQKDSGIRETIEYTLIKH
jgi:hypothetical protein